jgi:hypothetical protein
MSIGSTGRLAPTVDDVREVLVRQAQREPMSAPRLLATVHGPLADCTCRAVVAAGDSFEHQPGCAAKEER